MATVFYSWQSDLPNATNRGLIETALEKAIKHVNEARSEGVDLVVLDRDTANVAGAPEIAATIFDKIDQAHAFVADVTTVLRREPNATRTGRASPNPNVLIELGYAAKALGWERIICVANVAQCTHEDLPFDLRGRRVLSYKMSVNDRDRKPGRDRLAKDLASALRSIVDQAPESLSLAAERNQLEVERLRNEVEPQRSVRRDRLNKKIERVAEEELSRRRTNWFGVLLVPVADIELELDEATKQTLAAPDLVHDRHIQFEHFVARDDAYQSFLPYDDKPHEAHYLIKLRRDGVVHVGTDRVVSHENQDLWWPIVAARECIDGVRMAQHAWSLLGKEPYPAVAVVSFDLANEVGLHHGDDPRSSRMRGTNLPPGPRKVRREIAEPGQDHGMLLAQQVLDRLYRELDYSRCPLFTDDGQFAERFLSRLR